MSKQVKRGIDPTPFVDAMAQEFGKEGVRLAFEVLDSFSLYQHASPWARIRMVDWQDTADLKDLFESESLSTAYGSFIDQRFIDFLHANFDSIDTINWRKFEALTCEYFEREGFRVEIGEGRDDGNIDARIWSESTSRDQPPALLVQCKRQKRKVDKVVVKALWADIAEEQAQGGLIVTTTGLSPGARAVKTARSYPIQEADRTTLKTWLQRLRTPFSGVFLGQ
jgi:restriction system protein